jgi:hypothetical protein
LDDHSLPERLISAAALFGAAFAYHEFQSNSEKKQKKIKSIIYLAIFIALFLIVENYIGFQLLHIFLVLYLVLDRLFRRDSWISGYEFLTICIFIPSVALLIPSDTDENSLSLGWGTVFIIVFFFIIAFSVAIASYRYFRRSIGEKAFGLLFWASHAVMLPLTIFGLLTTMPATVTLVCSLKSGPLFELVPASDMELRHGQEIYA